MNLRRQSASLATLSLLFTLSCSLLPNGNRGKVAPLPPSLAILATPSSGHPSFSSATDCSLGDCCLGDLKAWNSLSVASFCNLPG